MPRSALRVALALLALALLALPAAPQPSAAAPAPAQTVGVAIVEPSAGLLFRTSVNVSADITAGRELRSVVAALGTYTTTLTFAGGSGATLRFTGALATPELAHGQHTLTVTATDVEGASGQASVVIFRSLPPRIAFESPADFSVAQPGLPIRVRCTDDNPAGCKTVSVVNYVDRFTMQAVISGTTGISQSVALDTLGRKSLILRAWALDSEGQYSDFLDRVVYVDIPANPLVSVSGNILDADPTHLLAVRYDQERPVAGLYTYVRPVEALELVARSSGQTTLISDTLSYVGFAELIPGGAVFIDGGGPTSVGPYRLFEWRNGAITDLGPLDMYEPLPAVAGRYVAWSPARAPNAQEPFELLLRDTSAGTTAQVAEDIADGQFNLAANGDLIYVSADNKLKRFRDGVTTTLDEGGDYALQTIGTDGTNVLYARVNQDNSRVLILRTPTAEQTIDGGAWLNNGWLVYTRPNELNVPYLWRRSPDGREERLAEPLGSIQELGPDGTIRWTGEQGQIWVSRPGQPRVLVSTNPESKVYLRDGVVERSLGRTLFGVQSHHVGLPLLSR